MTIGDFKTLVLGYLKREYSDLVWERGELNVDILTSAINNAKDYIQRTHDFNWQKAFCKATVIGGSANILTDVVNANTDDPVKVRNIIAAYIKQDDDYKPIRFWSKKTYQHMRLRESALGTHCGPRKEISLNQFGQEIWLEPKPIEEPYDIYFDAVTWIENFDDEDEETTHFLFDYGRDYLLFRTIFELNYFIGDDERLGIDANAMADAWKSLVAWDTHIETITDSELDL